jgi:hypothetical protein
VDALINDLTAAAHEAVERAAAEAARAASLASLERELSLLQAKALAVSEAQRLEGENSRLKQSRVRTAVVTGLVCFLGGLATGTTVLLMGR